MEIEHIKWTNLFRNLLYYHACNYIYFVCLMILIRIKHTTSHACLIVFKLFDLVKQ